MTPKKRSAAKGTTGWAGLLEMEQQHRLAIPEGAGKQGLATHTEAPNSQQAPRWRPHLRLHRRLLTPQHRQQTGAATKCTADGPVAAPP